jgi:DNA mismatch repair protein MutS
LFDQAAPETSSSGAINLADPLRDRLDQINPDSLSPREALDLLYELKGLGSKGMGSDGMGSDGMGSE